MRNGNKYRHVILIMTAVIVTSSVNAYILNVVPYICIP